jgi:UDP-N-acetylmuramyl tripeptide synthase
MESYFKAKRILFDKLLKRDGFAVLNALDPTPAPAGCISGARYLLRRRW